MNNTHIDFLKLVEEMKELGLWPRNLSPPDPQTLDRLNRLDEDIFKPVIPEGFELVEVSEK